MLPRDLIEEALDMVNIECWERERTATLTRRAASRSHTRVFASTRPDVLPEIYKNFFGCSALDGLTNRFGSRLIKFLMAF